MSSPGGTGWLGKMGGATKPPPPGGGGEPPTPETQKRVDAAKAYIENLYRNQQRSLQQRMERRAAVAGDEELPVEAKQELLQELDEQERKYTRLKRAKLTAEDFEPLTQSSAGERSERSGSCAIDPTGRSTP